MAIKKNIKIGIAINHVLRDMSQLNFLSESYLESNKGIETFGDFSGDDDDAVFTSAMVEKPIIVQQHVPDDLEGLVEKWNSCDSMDFLYGDFAFHIFGAARATKNIIETFRLQYLPSIELFSFEKNAAIPATYHFLAREKCTAKTVRFFDNESELLKQNYDYILTASPTLIKLKDERIIGITASYLNDNLDIEGLLDLKTALIKCFTNK